MHADLVILCGCPKRYSHRLYFLGSSLRSQIQLLMKTLIVFELDTQPSHNGRSSKLFNQEWFQQTKPKKVRLANFRERSPELVLEPPFACKYHTKPPKKGVPELIPDSFPDSSRTSLSSVWFAGATPDSIPSESEKRVASTELVWVNHISATALTLTSKIVLGCLLLFVLYFTDSKRTQK